MAPDGPLVLPKAQPPRHGPPPWALRLLAGVVAAPLTGLLAFVLLLGTGWGSETDPGDQLRRDLPLLIAGAVAGAGFGAALGYALAGSRRVPILVLLALSTCPSLVIGAAYFTESF
jgi:hypothetical protein